MSRATRKLGSITARVRWRCQKHAGWEIETRHPGFTSAEDAALYANGFLTGSPGWLVLDRGRLRLHFTDGRTVEMRSGTFQVWRLAEEFKGTVADDASFKPADVPLQALSDMGLDGAWSQLAYGVVNPNGEAVDVVLEIDETGDLKVITIEERPPATEEEVASFSLGIPPRA